MNILVEESLQLSESGMEYQGIRGRNGRFRGNGSTRSWNCFWGCCCYCHLQGTRARSVPPFRSCSSSFSSPLNQYNYTCLAVSGHVSEAPALVALHVAPSSVLVVVWLFGAIAGEMPGLSAVVAGIVIQVGPGVLWGQLRAKWPSPPQRQQLIGL